MEPNVCREIFTEKKTVIYCYSHQEFETATDGSNQLNGFEQILKHNVAVELRVSFLPSDRVGLIYLWVTDEFNPYDEDELEAAGFPNQVVQPNMRTEAELIRAAILYFDNFIQHLNTLSPHDESELGRRELPAALSSRQAA